MIEDELYQYTRITKSLFVQLRDLLYDNLSHATHRAKTIDVETQLIAGLIFYASGSFQWGVSSGLGIAQSSVSRVINAVTDALCGQAPNFIKFPSDRIEIRDIEQGFYTISNFPNVVGCINCTHIRVKSPVGVDNIPYLKRLP